MLQPVEEAFDQIALSVECVIDRALDLAVAAGWDVSASAPTFDQINDGAGVIAAICNEVALWFKPFNQTRRNSLVRGLALRKHYAYRHSRLIDDRVDLGAQSSTRTANGVIRTPFLPPAACWWARMMELSINCNDCGDLAAKVSNIRSQTPALAQRLNRLYTVV